MSVKFPPPPFALCATSVSIETNNGPILCMHINCNDETWPMHISTARLVLSILRSEQENADIQVYAQINRERNVIFFF
jgi:hypothetical protein